MGSEMCIRDSLCYDCCAEPFLEAACLSMNSQKTVHARAFNQPEPEFSCCGFGLFQSLLHPFRWTRVTEALEMTTKRLWTSTVPKISSLRLRIFRWREVGILGADQKDRSLWERQLRGSKPTAKAYENLRNPGGIKFHF